MTWVTEATYLCNGRKGVLYCTDASSRNSFWAPVLLLRPLSSCNHTKIFFFFLFAPLSCASTVPYHTGTYIHNLVVVVGKVAHHPCNMLPDLTDLFNQ